MPALEAKVDIAWKVIPFSKFSEEIILGVNYNDVSLTFSKKKLKSRVFMGIPTFSLHKHTQTLLSGMTSPNLILCPASCLPAKQPGYPIDPSPLPLDLPGFRASTLGEM